MFVIILIIFNLLTFQHEMSKKSYNICIKISLINIINYITNPLSCLSFSLISNQTNNFNLHNYDFN